MRTTRGGKGVGPRTVPVLCILVALLLPVTALAVSAVNTGFLSKVAIKGYDPVAYFTAGKPTQGKKAHSYDWMGATWRFANAKHQKRFRQNPQKYAPQYGGYCAYAVSQGITANIDPQAWRIIDGKLYLNLSPNIQAIWQQDIPGYIAKADANWPKLVD